MEDEPEDDWESGDEDEYTYPGDYF